MTTQYWLVKSEPGTYSWDDFVAERRTAWTGVRNYAARLHLQAMRAGDQVLFYHSGEAKSIVGLARVTRAAFPDPTADEPGWVAVGLAAGRPLPSPVTLATVKATPALKDMALIRLGRLSVQPVKPAEFKAVLKLAGG
ncbi:MAG TPA: EVE domain-containing protein [Lacunisphaera sp.]|jgi:predicted RNA-binding protein with PUA-like domain|nr:EVE domain-containing protein [Lacunisphaera sp.]